MRKLNIIVPLVTLFAILHAQQQDTTNFIQLNAGEKKIGKVELHDPFLSRSYLLLDDTTRIEIKDIFAYQNNDGYFVRVPNSTMLLKRVKQGKVDLFSKTVSQYQAGTSYSFNTPGGMVTNTTPGYMTTASIEYFSKGDQPVQDVSYSNLRKALADNTESMKRLDEYRTLNYFKYGLGIAGLGIVVAGLAAKDGPSKNTIITGAVIMNLAWIPSLMQGGKLDTAINAYNK